LFQKLGKPPKFEVFLALWGCFHGVSG
jgi:hypothetical protein